MGELDLLLLVYHLSGMGKAILPAISFIGEGRDGRNVVMNGNCMKSDCIATYVKSGLPVRELSWGVHSGSWGSSVAVGGPMWLVLHCVGLCEESDG